MKWNIFNRTFNLKCEGYLNIYKTQWQKVFFRDWKLLMSTLLLLSLNRIAVFIKKFHVYRLIRCCWFGVEREPWKKYAGNVRREVIFFKRN